MHFLVGASHRCVCAYLASKLQKAIKVRTYVKYYFFVRLKALY